MRTWGTRSVPYPRCPFRREVARAPRVGTVRPVNDAASKWSDERLDALRLQGDPEADEVIRKIFARDEVDAVADLLSHLLDNDDAIPEALPDDVEEYFRTTGHVSAVEINHARIGENFFATHGPEIMLVLCCNSLPFDYANKRAVGVLYQTGFLNKRPNRRVAQTAQMILDVMAPGGLTSDGFGIRSAQKVRLMHAAIRHLILTNKDRAWDVDRLGIPINQADLLYTLMSFSQVVLDGLQRMKLEVTRREGEAYLASWRIVGRIMGIEPSVIPESLEEAAALTKRMAQREHGASHEGKVMMEALAGLVGDVLGRPLSMFKWSLIRFFVSPSVCRMLGVPRHPVRDRLAHSITGLALLLDHAVDRPGPMRRWFRSFSVRMIQFFIEQELGPTSRTFRIPEELHRDWEVPGQTQSNFVTFTRPMEAE